MNKVLLAVFKACLSHLNRRHRHNVLIIVGITSFEPPCIDLSGDPTVGSVLLELVGLIWIPHWAEFFVLLSSVFNLAWCHAVR